MAWGRIQVYILSSLNYDRNRSLCGTHFLFPLRNISAFGPVEESSGIWSCQGFCLLSDIPEDMTVLFEIPKIMPTHHSSVALRSTNLVFIWGLKKKKKEDSTN